MTKPYQSQLPEGGNNIPESYLREWRARWGMGEPQTDATPEDEPDADLARFLRDEL